MRCSKRPTIGPPSCSSRITISACLPRYLKERNPNLIVAQFWHIPWPNRETFRVFPWKEELLDGLLGNDLLGFHLRYHCQNFLETVDRTIEARIDHERRRSSATTSRPWCGRSRSASISSDSRRLAVSTEVEQEIGQLDAPARPRGDVLGIGIERIDYTKGIPERLQALDRFFERSPEYPRATDLHPGRRAEPGAYPVVPGHRRGDRLPGRANQLEMEHVPWRPIIYFKRHFSMVEMMALHRHGRFLHRQFAARRNEPGRQGVRGEPSG